MCGRYYLTDEAKEELEQIVHNLDERIRKMNFKQDVMPSMMAPVLVEQEEHIQSNMFSWGYHLPKQKKLIINARCESVLEKAIFASSMELQRCVIPAAGFYEWNSQKQKYQITQPPNRLLYFAGLFRKEEGTSRFVILTTQANESMKEVHTRMPLILNKEQMNQWLRQKKEAVELLKMVPSQVKTYTENEQLSLDFTKM